MKVPKLADSGIPSDRDALAFILECCGKSDAEALADRLLREYGTSDAVLEHFDLLDAGASANVFAACIEELGTSRELHFGRRSILVDNTEDAGRLLITWFYGCTVEQFVLLCLDADFRLVECSLVESGGAISVRLDPKKLLRAVTRWDTKYLIIAHNHPSTPALPSRQDITSTSILLRLFRTAGYELLDHIVVYGDDFVSMRESGLLDVDERFDAELSVKRGRVDYTKL